ncbi:MarR family transcriptional regulator [Anaerofustis sp.]|uniref:MarR family winged helix-turn-helix transcriptional regulator n=1 Tax=Anaerofustis sp. TaxID=1872517 RepID=UPI0025BB1B6F|nr:MarR family transcriptional regulator [Anaerofustis sp.]
MDNIEFYFKRINDAMISRINNELKELDLTFSQMEVLQYLCERGDKEVFQKDIEKYLNLTHPTVIGILKRLQSKDLIVIEISNKDKRKRKIIPTDKVMCLKEKMYKKKEETEKYVKSFYTDEEVKELERLLKKLCDNIICDT